MVYMYHSFLIHLSADGHLGCFHALAIINSAAMNIGVHMSLSDLVSLVCMPRSEIAESYDSSISSFLRNLQSLCSFGRWIIGKQATEHRSQLGGSFNDLLNICGKQRVYTWDVDIPLRFN